MEGRANRGCKVMELCGALCKVHARVVEQGGGDEAGDSRSTCMHVLCSYQLTEDTRARPDVIPAHGGHRNNTATS